MKIENKNWFKILIKTIILRGEMNQKGVSDISPTLQESQNNIFTIVWSDFVYWFQLFIIQICTLMDDSTFVSRKSSLRTFILYIYIYISISPKNVTPFWFSPLDIISMILKINVFFKYTVYKICRFCAQETFLIIMKTVVLLNIFMRTMIYFFFRILWWIECEKEQLF